MYPTVVLDTAGAEAEGGSVGRLPDGRVVFVRGALPDERVSATVVDQRGRFAFAEATEVIVTSPSRVEPVCPSVAEGCGGCDLQHASVELQRSMKLQVLNDAIRRIGRIPEPPEIEVVELPVSGFRTTVRAAVDDGGRLGYRHGRSHELVAAPACLIAHPLAAELLAGARFPGADEVTIRVGERTGEVLVVVDPGVGRVVLPPGWSDDDIGLVGAADASSSFIHEVVADRRWRISGASFFQSRRDGAEALVAAVRSAVEDLAGRPRRLVDLYAGVGLFAATVGADNVVAVEASRASISDARHNLADLGDRARCLAVPVERWRPSPADVVVADPPRAGLRRHGVERVVATGAGVVVLVSCDSGSFGRDAGLLVDAGFRLERVVLVDMFPHSHHVEVVSAFLGPQRST